MSDPVNPTQAKIVDPNLLDNKAVETVIQAYPPLVAWSNTEKAAVSGTNTSTGNGVYGKSAKGDAIHGESAGSNMSGVAGIHTAGGNGIYGKSSGNAGCFDGNVQLNGNLTVTGDVYLPGADCAEQFDFVGALPIEAGSLVVIDESGALRESQCAYDRKVAGVVAGAGAYRPGIVLDKNSTGAPRIVISLVGKVYCKVDADYGPIEVGELLTSSSTPGHAMKASDSKQAFGAVVGKALRPLASGQGLIPILIALQ
jgi:hypothetical protein